MSESILINAVRNNSSLQVRQLMRDGVPPDQRSADGESPLTIAARNGYTGIAKDILAAGGDRDFIGAQWQMSPLQLAVAYGHRGIVALLLPLADVDLIEPQFGQTALFFIVTKLAMRSSERSLEILKLLLTADPDCGIKNFAGQTVLELAVAAGLTSHIELLNAAC